MFYWKNVIKVACVFTCFINALLGFYEMCFIKEQSIPELKPEQYKSVDVQQKHRSQQGYLRLRHYQRITRQEINRKRIVKIIKALTGTNRLLDKKLSQSDGDTSSLVGCNFEDNKQAGRLIINQSIECNESESYLEQYHKDIKYGGYWKPFNCSRHSLVIVIPFRDRHNHLCVLLRYLVPMLKLQQIEFTIVLAEQVGNDTFNKGKLMNAAFLESLKLFTFNCAVFHDVDLIPEDNRNIYYCPEQPSHLSVSIDEMNYKLQYEMLVGGVLAIKNHQFEMVNGYSNQFWGWGGEDDDMAYRILLAGLRILRPPHNIARYKMLKHQKQVPAKWKSRFKLLSTVSKRFLHDGLNSANYSIKKLVYRRFYTHFYIDVGTPLQ